MKYIIFHDKSFMEIPDEKYVAFIEASTSDARGFDLNGQYVTFSSIAKILDQQEYYEQYPDRKPVPQYNEFEKYDGFDYKKINRKRALQGFIKGFKQAMEEGHTSNWHTHELEKMENKLKIL